MRTPNFSVEVIMVPVSVVERALRFYVDQLGFTLDVDYAPNDAFRVVQFTPRRHGPEPSVGGKLNYLILSVTPGPTQ